MKTIVMKKRNFTSLKLNKTSISNFKNTAILGGNSRRCHPFGQFYKTKICSSPMLQDCTVTYEACVTQPRFCGAN